MSAYRLNLLNVQVLTIRQVSFLQISIIFSITYSFQLGMIINFNYVRQSTQICYHSGEFGATSDFYRNSSYNY